MEEREPETPNLSITIPLSGENYLAVLKAMNVLTEATGQTTGFPPHVTLQQVYNKASSDDVAGCIQGIGKGLKPFELMVSGLGLLSTPGQNDRWHLHLHVRKSEEILSLYTLVTDHLQRLGLRTYSYTISDWIPHLTLASGTFSKKLLKKLIKKLEGIPTTFILPVRSLEVHKFQLNGGWELVDHYDLAVDSAFNSESYPQTAAAQAITSEQSIL